MAVMCRLGAHAAPDLDDIAGGLALAAEQFDGVFTGSAADQLVVAADELRVLSVSTLRSSTKTGIFASIACCTTPVTRGFLRRHQQRIDFLADQVLDIGDLLFRLVLAVGDDQFDFRMLGGLSEMSLLNWARQGSMVVTCEKPIFHFLSCAKALPLGKKAVVVSSAAVTAASFNNSRRFNSVSSNI